MLDIQVTLKGEKAFLTSLNRLDRNLPDAIERGLSNAAKSIFSEAHLFLDGAGAKGEYSSGRWKKRETPISSGGYPVPVRTGHLKRSLNFLQPGESKNADGLTFTAGKMEAVIFDSAEYAGVIHEGRGSSAKFGPRSFLTDALEKFDQGRGIALKIEKEIHKEIR